MYVDPVKKEDLAMHLYFILLCNAVDFSFQEKSALDQAFDSLLQREDF